MEAEYVYVSCYYRRVTKSAISLYDSRSPERRDYLRRSCTRRRDQNFAQSELNVKRVRESALMRLIRVIGLIARRDDAASLRVSRR
jgi:hypothetical protein